MNGGSFLESSPQKNSNSYREVDRDVDKYLENSEPPQSNGENKIRQITINEVNRGFIVNVGCHTFAISTKTELLNKLLEYIENPAETEKKWHTNQLF